jgi:hypothetical protein
MITQIRKFEEFLQILSHTRIIGSGIARRFIFENGSKIFETYENTHQIIIGGDFNENILLLEGIESQRKNTDSTMTKFKRRRTNGRTTQWSNSLCCPSLCSSSLKFGHCVVCPFVLSLNLAIVLSVPLSFV